MDTSGHLVMMMSNEAEKVKMQQHASTERRVTLGKDWRASHKPGLLEERRVRSVREASSIPGTTTQQGQNGLVHYCQFLLTPRWVGGGDCGQRRIQDLLLKQTLPRRMNDEMAKLLGKLACSENLRSAGSISCEI